MPPARRKWSPPDGTPASHYPDSEHPAKVRLEGTKVTFRVDLLALAKKALGKTWAPVLSAVLAATGMAGYQQVQPPAPVQAAKEELTKKIVETADPMAERIEQAERAQRKAERARAADRELFFQELRRLERDVRDLQGGTVRAKPEP